MLSELGRFVLIASVILIAAGIVLMLIEKVPLVGRLPGDIVIKRKNFTFYFPLATSVLLSIILTILLSLLRRR